MPITKSITLNQNIITKALFNMIISQHIFDGKVASDELANKFRVDGTLYGDTKIYQSFDIGALQDWLNDREAPNLLEKRLGVREKENTQKGVVALSGLLFIAGFVVAGLDYRLGWSHVPMWTVTLASVILLVAYGFYAEVMRENAYLSRMVEVQENQKVIDTGLYGIVRHPMYAVTIWLFLAIPVVLG